MRTRNEIESDHAQYEKLFLEVLLDIRELQIKNNKRKRVVGNKPSRKEK